MGEWIRNQDAFNQQMDDFVTRYDTQDKGREVAINASRAILKLAKQATYSVHRNEHDQAKQLLAEAINEAKQFTESDEQQIGAVRAALEELAEAQLFYSIIVEQQIILHTDMQFILSFETYLGGLADTTGELVRYATLQASKKDEDAVKSIQALVDTIHGQFLKFDFRNSDLRKKSDSVKYNLAKLDQLSYEISRR